MVQKPTFEVDVLVEEPHGAHFDEGCEVGQEGGEGVALVQLQVRVHAEPQAGLDVVTQRPQDVFFERARHLLLESAFQRAASVRVTLHRHHAVF